MKLSTIWYSAFTIFLGFGSIVVPQLRAATNQSIAINTGWEFRQLTAVKGIAIQRKWLPAQVPGDIHLDLLRNKLIPPPFYRNNETKLQWIENADWEYRTSIPVDAKLLNRKNVDLVFEGLDTCASVYLNATLVLTSDDMFRTYRIDVKPHLKRGENQLRVLFTSPIRCAAKVAAKDQWRPITKIPTQSYIRKAAYEYGWEGGPRFVTSGIWQPVRLEAWDNARISDFNMRQMDVTRQCAHIIAEVGVVAAQNTLATIAVTGKHIYESASEITVLHPGINHLELPLTIEKPELWYPVGYGWQPIYDFHADVAIGGVIQDSRNVRVPLRSLQLRRESSKSGQHFEFVVNGIPVFVKGAIVVPFDSFPNRVTNEHLRYILQSAIDANMNMVRVWGGGYYEPKEFYQLCDELGIMVWQDFMFGTSRLPGTDAFKRNIAHEVKDQLKRLQSYSSIVLWYGNDEPQSRFDENSQNGISEAYLQIWKSYLTTFNGIIPTEIARYAPATPYWPSFFNSDHEEPKIGNDRILNNKEGVADNQEVANTNTGEMEASDATLSDFLYGFAKESHYRLPIEHGFPAFPDMRTIEAFTLPQDRTSLDTTVMKAHKKVLDSTNVNTYKVIYDQVLQTYGKPKDLSSMVYLSQILQAEYVKAIAEHIRQNRPYTMGSIFWQLNDCWPGITSSSIDYYGRWKALQDYARRFYASLLVSPAIRDQHLNIYVISDKTKPVSGTLRLRIMKTDGTVLSEKTENIIIPELSSYAYIQLPIESFMKVDEVDSANIFAAADLAVDGKQVSTNIMYFPSTRRLRLSVPHIESRLTGANGSYDLHLSSKALARSVYISFESSDVKLSDNYFDLLPGEPKDIRIDSSVSLDQLTKQMRVISLADAIVSNTTEKGFVWK